MSSIDARIHMSEVHSQGARPSEESSSSSAETVCKACECQTWRWDLSIALSAKATLFGAAKGSRV